MLAALSVTRAETVVATVSWAACSISMTLLNKVSISRTRAPVAVVIVQMLATALLAVCSRDLKFGQGWRTWALTVPPLFVLMMITSMLALKHVTVGTFVVVRNLGPIVTLAIETAVHQPDNLSFDWKSAGSTGMIALGVWLYEATEVGFSPVGLAYLLANLAFACAERMVQRHLLAVKTIDVNKPALMLLNNGARPPAPPSGPPSPRRRRPRPGFARHLPLSARVARACARSLVASTIIPRLPPTADLPPRRAPPDGGSRPT